MQNLPQIHRRFAASILALALMPLTAAAAWAQGLETEPNHPCTQAQDMSALSLPASVSGSLDTPPEVPDVDFYRFPAAPGAVIAVRLDSAGAQGIGDALLGIFAGDCATLLAYDDDSGEGLNSLVRFTVPASGAFVVAATSYSDFGFTGQGSYSGGYLVSVEPQEVASSVGGRAVDARTGAPLPFAQVDLLRCTGGSCFNFFGYTYTDFAGNFRFSSGDYTVFGQPLEVGDYKIVVRAANYLDGEVGPFHLSIGEARDLGDVAVQPVPTLNSIAGRAVDAISGAPLRGDAVPFAAVELRYCGPFYGGYCYGIRYTGTDAQGDFRFDGSSSAPLLAGTYQVAVYADQYQGTVTDPFTVDEFEDYDLGDVPVKSFPVRLYLRQGCGPIPSTGGTCRFTVDVANGMAERFHGQVWGIVNAFAGGAEPTTFQVGNARSLLLAPSASATATLSFSVPGDVPDGTYICTRLFAAQHSNSFRTLGSHDLFCLIKGYGGFLKVPEERKRELFHSPQGELRRRRP